MSAGGDKNEQNPNQGKARTWNGRYVNIAHRRSPSELTPLIQQNMALQQQVELLTAQNQHMMHQQQLHQNLQHQNLPNQHQNLQHSGIIASQPPLQSATLLPPPPVFHSRGNSLSMSPPSPHHNRQRSMGHARRHSLAVNEAKKLAQERASTGGAGVGAANAAEGNGGSGGSGSGGASPATPTLGQLGPAPSLSNTQPPFGSPGPIETPQFRFPPSPDRSRSHSRSHSVNSFRRQTPSPQKFQFPPASGNESSHGGYQSSGHASGGGYSHHQSNYSHGGGHSHQRSASLSSPHYTFGGGHHSQGPSFHSRKSSQWEGHRHRPSNASDFSPNNNNNSNARKSLFVPYLPQSAIPEMLSDGLLVTGTLRVNHKNRSYAYVSTDLLDADVLIDGSKDRNRALEGDLVAVELLDVDDVWEQKMEKEERKRRRDGQGDHLAPPLPENALGASGGSSSSAPNTTTTSAPSEGGEQSSSEGGGATSLRRKGSLRQRPVQKRNDDVEVEGQTLFLREELWRGDKKPLYCGHVVAVLERPAGQLFSGTLGLLRPSSQATKERQMHSRTTSVSNSGAPNQDVPKIVWFKPTDKCVPLMAIPTEQAPHELIENPQAFMDRIYVGQIKRWPITSLHPFGTLVESLGTAGGPGVAMRAVLRDFNFSSHVFSDHAIEEAKTAGLQMSESAAQLPSFGATAVQLAPDLCASVFSGEFSKVLAVHVLDIVPFIVRNSALDKELRHKSSGVYMHGYESPLMAPEAQKFVEFQPGRVSPTLTVEIGLDTGSVEIKRFSVEPIKLDINSSEYAEFVSAASTLRRRRGLGSIEDPSVDLSHLLDVVVPASSPLGSPTQQGRVLNEIMHSANSAVASELLRSQEVGLNALVRCQSEPSLARLEQLAQFLRSQGIKVDTSSAQTLSRSLAEQLSPRTAKAIKVLLSKLLSRQRYAIAAKTDPGQLGHYWFGFDAYTHFTRPLLRYADQVVARQVHAVLDGATSSIGGGSSSAAGSAFGSPGGLGAPGGFSGGPGGLTAPGSLGAPGGFSAPSTLGVPGGLGAPGGLEISAIPEDAPTTPTMPSPATPPEPSSGSFGTPNSTQGSFHSNKSGTNNTLGDNNTHLAPELSFRYDCARAAQEQSSHLELSEELSSEYKLVSGIVVAVYESAFDVVIPEMSVEKRVHGDQLPLVKAEHYPEENRLELFWTPGADSVRYNESSAKQTQPEIPLELKEKLVLREGNVQDVRALSEVPVLIRVSKEGRVLPSITVRAANPFFAL